jgi:hypothetical protein
MPARGIYIKRSMVAGFFTYVKKTDNTPEKKLM